MVTKRTVVRIDKSAVKSLQMTGIKIEDSVVRRSARKAARNELDSILRSINPGLGGTYYA